MEDDDQISLRRRPLKTLTLFTAYLFDQAISAGAAAAAHPFSLYIGCPSVVLYLALKYLGAYPEQLRDAEVRTWHVPTQPVLRDRPKESRVTQHCS